MGHAIKVMFYDTILFVIKMYTQSKFNHFSDFLPTCPADNLGRTIDLSGEKFVLSPDKRISAISTPGYMTL